MPEGILLDELALRMLIAAETGLGPWLPARPSRPWASPEPLQHRLTDRHVPPLN
jgi:hypothetical protein